MFIPHGSVNTKEFQKQEDEKNVTYQFCTWGPITIATNGEKWIVEQQIFEDKLDYAQRYFNKRRGCAAAWPCAGTLRRRAVRRKGASAEKPFSGQAGAPLQLLTRPAGMGIINQSGQEKRGSCRWLPAQARALDPVGNGIKTGLDGKTPGGTQQAGNWSGHRPFFCAAGNCITLRLEGEGEEGDGAR